MIKILSPGSEEEPSQTAGEQGGRGRARGGADTGGKPLHSLVAAQNILNAAY